MLSELESLPSIQLGEFTLRFELDELTPFGEEVASRELRENPENRENGIKELRKLLQQGEPVINLSIRNFIITSEVTTNIYLIILIETIWERFPHEFIVISNV